jgi:hypothetical protein
LPIHDTPRTIQDIFTEVQVNLFDAGLKWYSQDDILNSIQDQYNRFVALFHPIEKSTTVPQQATPHYQLGRQIPDMMYVSAVWNPTINQWLRGVPEKHWKAHSETHMVHGNARFLTVLDFNWSLIWPYNPNPSGVLLVVYKAHAPTITMTHVPLLPYSVASQLLEYSTTADLLEQAREFKKAGLWWDKVYKAPEGQKSIYQQAKLEVKALARMDREMVLEPYRWIFHGGATGGGDEMWVSNEVPGGAIDGVNATYTLVRPPNPSASLLLMKNGQVLFNGSGYSLSGSTIVINPDYILQPPSEGFMGDELRAWYIV